MDRGEMTQGNRLVGAAVGGLGAVGTALVLVPFRSEIDNANLALVLVLVVVVAAIVGGSAGAVVAAFVATLSFDFFLTRPYLSMRINSADDIETMVILLAVGLLVGEVAARGRRSRRHQERTAEAIDRVQRVADQVAHGAGLATVRDSVTEETAALLQLFDCWLELPPFSWVLPELERAGTLEASEHHWSSQRTLGLPGARTRGGFALPEDGVELAVLQGGRQVARLVLLGNPAVDTTLEERVVAIALADQLGHAFAMASPEELAQVEADAHED